MVWRKPANHFDECYFFLTKTAGYSKKNKCTMEYPNMPSAIRPVHHGVGLPIPTPPVNWADIHSSSSEKDDQPHTTDSGTDPTYIPQNACEPHLIQRYELKKKLFLSDHRLKCY
ncbi:hypothetical protein PR048_009381 [Dryococelus australis]|uniref:Uncharacterized protein n=1 Tax=Dryococelus australis TaxID=614101 RepID=A0ABQ9HZQ3_9NEOP|nr:hypothetical protein PR048_009381 [Dryococelus australis]